MAPITFKLVSRAVRILSEAVVRARRWTRQIPGRLRGAYVELSLVRLAEHGKEQLAVVPRWRRRRRNAWEWVKRRALAESSCWWLFVFGFGMQWLPIPWGLRQLTKNSSAVSFLEALWQVEGATLAIALAVVIFVFQAVYASRLSGSLRQFAEETGLFPIFFFGVYAVGLVGVALLGGGYGAPGGWSGTWSTFWGAAEAVLLIVLFIETIRAIEPDALHKRRLAAARREIERETERLILQRIATNLLNRYCEENGIEFTAAFGSAPSATATAITSQRTGEVKDIRLRRLRKLAHAAQRRELPKPRLRAYTDVPVSHTTEVLWAEPSALGAVRRPRRIFRYRRARREQAFRDTIQRLHDEATRVIASPTPGAYEDILDVYEDKIVALPTTWAKYGQDYAPAIAGGVSPFELEFLDYLGRDLYDEIRSAVLGTNREIAHTAMRFPFRIAHEAVELRATALSARMLQLIVGVLEALLRAPDSEVKRELFESTENSLVSYGSYRVEPLITDDAKGEAEQAVGRLAMRQLYETLAEICKRILDLDAGQVALLTLYNGIYEKFFRHWNPEHEDPQRWDLDFAEQRGEAPEIIEQLRARVEENEARVALRDELDDWRLMHRLGLMFWVLRHVRAGADPAWVDAWPQFANYIGDIPKLARVLDKAIQSDFEDRSRWSNWILDTLPKGEVHGIGVDNELIDAFIVRALQLVPPDGPPPAIEPMTWTRGRLDDPEKRIKTIIEDEKLFALLPSDRLDDRARVLAEAVVASNQERQDREDQKTIDAALSDAKLAEFETGMLEAFEGERWLYRALDASGSVEMIHEEPAEDVSGSQVNTWLTKSFFVEDPTVLGIDMAARQYGVGLAEHERRHFVDQLHRAPLIESNAVDPLSDQLQAVIRSLIDDGFAPSLILTPFNWSVMQMLPVELYDGSGGDLDPPEWARTEGGRGVAFGAFERIPACRVHRGLDDRIVVVDLSKFATWREWRPVERPISFQWDYLNEVEAEQLARDKPQLFEGAGDLADRTKAVRMSVRLLAQSRWELEVGELEAARALEIPEGLRR